MLVVEESQEVVSSHASCPNCDSAGPLDYVLSIGCIVRSVHRRDAEHQRLLSKDLDVDLRLSDLPVEFFSDCKSHWIQLPPLLKSLHYEFDNLHAHRALMQKEVRVCGNCYDQFIDEIEEKRQHEKPHKQPTMPLQPPPYKPPTRMASYFYPPKNSDRTKDMAFTELQALQRKSEVLRQVKREVRERFILDNMQTVDWGSSEMATKQVKRITSAASSRAPLTEGDLTNSPRRLLMAIVKNDGSPPQGAGTKMAAASPASSFQIAPYSQGGLIHLHCSRPNTAGTSHAVPPLPHSAPDEIEPELAEAEPPMVLTAFDIPFHERLMFELWDTMRRECKFGATDEFLAAPPSASDPMFPVYRRNQYRFPIPPVLHISLAPPQPVSNSEPSSDDLDLVHRMDAYFPPKMRQLVSQCATSQVGLLLDLDPEEAALLADVMANDDIKMALGSDLDDEEAVSIDEDEEEDGEYYPNFDH
jgi:hypothetical protein